MASDQQTRAAVQQLVDGIRDIDTATRARMPGGTVSVLLYDLGTAFTAELTGGLLSSVAEVNAGDLTPAQLHLVMTSDQLVALVAGELSFTKAWATGKIRVDAGIRTLFELRKFL